MTNLKIKFWDKKLSVMWEPIELKKLLSYLLFQSMPNSDGYIALKYHFNEMIPLYSTGLKDKNGKEIYEGDFIDAEIILWSLPTMGQVVYLDEYQSYANRNYGGDTLLYKLREIKVIGNIYENPEIMEAK